MAVLPAQAKMTAMGDNQLDTVTGQGGIAFLVETLGLEMEGDTIYYHDEDGVNAGDTGAFLSFCGIDYQGTITYGRPLDVQVARFKPLMGEEPVLGINILIDDMTISIDSLDIDAIRVGPSIGSGLSFGAIALHGLVANIEGKVQIYYH